MACGAKQKCKCRLPKKDLCLWEQIILKSHTSYTFKGDILNLKTKVYLFLKVWTSAGLIVYNV